jgi:hypothetical protein
MMDQRTLMDVLADYESEHAELARNASIEQVESNADYKWLAGAQETVRELALSHPEFTTDLVWAAMEAAGWNPPRERRAMGAVMAGAARRKLVVKTDRVRNSVRVECHARPVAVWRSLLFAPSSGAEENINHENTNKYGEK